MKKLIILFFLNSIFSQQQIFDIDYKKMSEIIENESTVVVDVRTADEFNSFRIKNSINIDYYSKNFLDSISSYGEKKNIISVDTRFIDNKSLSASNDLLFSRIDLATFIIAGYADRRR